MKNGTNFAWVLLGSLAGAVGAYLLSRKGLRNDIQRRMEEDAGEAVKNAIGKYGEDRIRQTIDQKLPNDIVDTIRENCESKLEERIFKEVRRKANDSLDRSVKSVVEEIAHDEIDQEVKYKLASSKKFLEDAIRETAKDQTIDILKTAASNYTAEHMEPLFKKAVENYLRAFSVKDLDMTIRDVIYEKANDIFDSKVQAYIDRQLKGSIQSAIERRFQNLQNDPMGIFTDSKYLWKGGTWPNLI